MMGQLPVLDSSIDVLCLVGTIIGVGVGDNSVVESAPRDMQVLRGGGFKSHLTLLLGPHSADVLRRA